MVTKKDTQMEELDPGDKVAASLSFKKNLGNYESLDIYASATICRRESETSDAAWTRVWRIVEDQIDKQFEKVENLLAK